MIDIRPEHLAMVREIIERVAPQYEVWAFGSRVMGTAKKFSDLDLAIIADERLSISQLGRIKEAFMESDLPMKVDIIDYHAAIGEFQEVVRKHHVVLQKPKSPM